MKKGNIYYFLSFCLFVFMISCNNDDESNSELSCRIVKYDKIDFYDIQTGEINSDYLNYLFYEGDQVFMRENYGLVSNPSAGLSYFGLNFINKIYYDSQGRVEKIEYYMNSQTNSYRQDLFTYNGNSSNPSQRNKIENGYNWHEFIEYDIQGRILNTVTYWEEDEYPSETTSYEYKNGNLTKYNLSKISYTTGEIYEQWEYEFLNYDDMKNPYQLIEIPFVEDRQNKFSVNNYRKYTYHQTIPENGAIGEWEISGYEYDENGYAKTVEFECN